jgi:hypothetical protein
VIFVEGGMDMGFGDDMFFGDEIFFEDGFIGGGRPMPGDRPMFGDEMHMGLEEEEPGAFGQLVRNIFTRPVEPEHWDEMFFGEFSPEAAAMFGMEVERGIRPWVFIAPPVVLIAAGAIVVIVIIRKRRNRMLFEED